MTAIDIASLPAPLAIEDLSFENLRSEFFDRFIAAWDDERAQDPTLPAYDVQDLLTDPIAIVSEPFAYFRLLDRGRVNDAVKAVLAPFSKRADLDNLVAGRNISRLVVQQATVDRPAIYENDAQLLRRFLLSFERDAVSSAGGLRFSAFSAVPGLSDARHAPGIWQRSA